MLQNQIHLDAYIVMARGSLSVVKSDGHFNLKLGFRIEIL